MTVRKTRTLLVSSPLQESAFAAEETDAWPSDPSIRSEHLAPSITEMGRNSDEFAVRTTAPERADLAREVFGLVYRQMRSLVGARPEFEDLVQIAAEQALRGLGTFEGRSKLSTWTYRICYLTLRKHERWYRRWLRRFSLTERGELPESASREPLRETSLEETERVALLRRAVDGLSPKRRSVVTLHDLEGLPIDEVARVLKANPLTVRSRLRDGRKDLARILADDPYFGDEACRRQESES